MFNKVLLMGRICHDLELKTTPSGVHVLSFRIAVDRNYQVKGEERKADFFNVVAWRSTAEFVSKYFGKGRMIMVDGELQTRQYVDKNNVTQNIVEIVADSIHFTGEKAPLQQQQNYGGQGGGYQSGYQSQGSYGSGSTSSYNSGGSVGAGSLASASSGYSSGGSSSGLGSGLGSSGGGGYNSGYSSSGNLNSGLVGNLGAVTHPAETANSAPSTLNTGTASDFSNAESEDEYPF